MQVYEKHVDNLVKMWKSMLGYLKSLFCIIYLKSLKQCLKLSNENLFFKD